MEWIEEPRILPGVLYAMAPGGAIDLEREMKDCPAGFRTYVPVAGTAALLLGLGRMVPEDGRYAGTGLQIDPLRLVEAVVVGVYFIGAGTIFASRSGESVQGIATVQTRSSIPSTPACVAQWAQQKKRPSCSAPWPTMRQPQCSQAGATAWIAHSNES
jgi:hypothetical protein